MNRAIRSLLTEISRTFEFLFTFETPTNKCKTQIKTRLSSRSNIGRIGLIVVIGSFKQLIVENSTADIAVSSVWDLTYDLYNWTILYTKVRAGGQLLRCSILYSTGPFKVDWV